MPMRGLFTKFGLIATSGTAPRNATPVHVFPPTGASGSNVIPFARPTARGAEQPLKTDSAERNVPVPSTPAVMWIVCFVFSLMLHGGLLAALSRPPQPLAGLELPAMAVDLVFGADTPAGLAAKVNRNSTAQSAAHPKQSPPAEQKDSEPQQTVKAEPEPTPAPVVRNANPPSAAARQPTV